MNTDYDPLEKLELHYINKARSMETELKDTLQKLKTIQDLIAESKHVQHPNPELHQKTSSDPSDIGHNLLNEAVFHEIVRKDP